MSGSSSKKSRKEKLSLGTLEARLEKLETHQGKVIINSHIKEKEKNGVCVFCLEYGLLSYNHVIPRALTKHMKGIFPFTEDGISKGRTDISPAWYLVHSKCDSIFGEHVTFLRNFCENLDWAKPYDFSSIEKNKIIENLLWSSFLEYWARRLYSKERSVWHNPLPNQIRKDLINRDYSSYFLVGIKLKEFQTFRFNIVGQPDLINPFLDDNSSISRVVLGGIMWAIGRRPQIRSGIYNSIYITDFFGEQFLDSFLKVVARDKIENSVPNKKKLKFDLKEPFALRFQQSR